MPEKDVHSIVCPCCNETIPVRIDLWNIYLDKGFITNDGATISNEPFPIIEIGLSVNIPALADKMDILLPEYYELQKKIRGDSDDNFVNDKL